MELFAFVRPARFVLPTPSGLAQQLGLARPQQGEDMAALLPQIAFILLDELASTPDPARTEAGRIATMMTAGGWKWGPYILAHLGLPQPPAGPPDSRHAAIWDRLADYADYTRKPSPVPSPFCRMPPVNALPKCWEKMPNCAYPKLIMRPLSQPALTGPTLAQSPSMVLAEGRHRNWQKPSAIWHQQHCGPKRMGTVWISTYTRASTSNC